jgi:hypothetical protein
MASLSQISSALPSRTRISPTRLRCSVSLALFTGKLLIIEYAIIPNSDTSLSLANQEVLRWQLAMQKEIGDANITDDSIRDYLWKTLKSGQVVPGYGHGVLRSPDPRFIALQHFCEARPELESSPIIRMVKKVRTMMPCVW